MAIFNVELVTPLVKLKKKNKKLDLVSYFSVNTKMSNCLTLA